MKKVRFAHIINPVKVESNSDLFIAQPITFESMLKAKQFAEKFDDIEVELLYTCYKEDLEIIPDYLKFTNFLERSVLDVSSFSISKKLPLLKDILDNLYNFSNNADYIIYTNVDIALLPNFYVTLKNLLKYNNYDSLIINRRDIQKNLTDLSIMYSQVGKQHPGYDCFIFKKKLYHNFFLDNACIGINWIGTILMWNLACFSHSFEILKDIHLTFHLGEDKAWKHSKFDDYRKYNHLAAQNVYIYLQKNFNFKDLKHEKLLKEI